MKNMIEREQHLKKSEMVTLLASCKILPGDAHTNAPSDFQGGRALQVDETTVICWLAALEEFGKVEQ
jgi:hypothetical protein